MRLLLLLLFFYGMLFASPVILNSEQKSINIVPASQFFIDTEEVVTSDTVLDYDAEFTDAREDIYSFGFLNKPLWIRFIVKRGDGSQPWVLSIENPQIDYYRLYRLSDSRLESVGAGGDTVCFKDSKYQCRTYWEDIADTKDEQTYYLYVKTQGSLQVPLEAKQLSYAYNTEEMSMLLYGLYYGILLLLLVYNLVLYIVVKDIDYINYLLFLSSYLIWQLSFDGIGQEWLWPNWTWMANNGLSFFIFLSAALAFRFARSFLLLKKYRYSLFKMTIYAEMVSYLGVMATIFLEFHTSIRLAAVWTAIVPILLIYAGFKVLRLYHPARYYLMGWAFFLLATILVALDKLGILPAYSFMVHQQQIGSVLEMLFLSFALADRISLMKRDHIGELRRLTVVLQEKIDKKVEEARQKDKLLIQQSRQAAMGEMIENIAHQWRQPLNQLSLIQNNIFIDYMLDKLDEKNMERYQEQSEKLMRYMTETIDDFRNFFQPDREKRSFDVCKAIRKTDALVASALHQHSIDVMIRCDVKTVAFGHENEFSQVILNILNNAKDVLVERRVKDPSVTIRIDKNSDHSLIEICDNGGGVDEAIVDRIFDPYFTTKFKSQGTGIGLYMSKMIIENSMDGKLGVYNKKEGACFTIRLPLKEEANV